MATPFVTGAVALRMSQGNKISHTEVKRQLLERNNLNILFSLQGRTATGGIPNLGELIKPLPGATEITAPKGVILDNQPLVTWKPASNASSYSLVIDQAVGHRWHPRIRSEVSETSSIVELPSFGRYRARVRGENSSGGGPWSAWSYFDLGTPAVLPSKTRITAPVGAVATNRPKVVWDALSELGPVNGGTYIVLFEQAAGTSWQRFFYDGSKTNSYTPDRDFANGKYRVRVIGRNKAGSGPWSEWRYFQVGSIPLPGRLINNKRVGTCIGCWFPSYKWLIV